MSFEKRYMYKYAGPLVPGTEGEGGERFSGLKMPGVLYAKNLTPRGLVKDWTDRELLRAFTCGVTKDNTTLFPLMPYPGFNHLTKEDAYSIIAYIRTLRPIENQVAQSKLNFPLNYIVKTIPLKSFVASKPVDRSNSIEYGKYLVTIASCRDCHTPKVKGEFVTGKEYSGGNEFNLPWGIVRTANITPDDQTGIGKWTREQFIARFKFFDTDSTRNIPVNIKRGEFNTVMPWTFFAGMTGDDLGSIYDYLRTVKPIRNEVVKFTPKSR
jgi:hypothetical protein